MKFLYKLFKQNPDSRDGVIAVTSVLGVIVNVLVAGAKILIGALVHSIAIMTEGVNNASDAVTSMLAFVGSKLSKKHPDEKHPFGYGRIEYLASLVIAVLILITGFEFLTGAVETIYKEFILHEKSELDVDVISLIIVAVSAAIKLALGLYTIKMGKKVDSAALVGVGTECRNDCLASVLTIVSSVIFILFGFSVDAFAGLIISALLIKAGFDLLKDTVGDLIGRPGEHELASKLYKEIRSTDGVLAAADMMLHNYGPDSWSGSVNLELDHKMTVGEIYEFLHALQLRIMHEYKVTMVFGIYAVDNDREEMKELRKYIAGFVRSHEHVTSYHAVYIEPTNEKMYCDLIVDYKLKDWDTLRNDFTEYMKQKYPEQTLELTIETDFVGK